ncbi:BadF/BadG/BcrA/BcrD ATPase family protein [Microlunatus speluncae]|uniref:BadF/BadG/BcrA/BcrD ATPase family protein n=1 Tax=Microlunatus speluncae TaxID=2594267 RepID=UPI00137565D5|nr:BadF/BadG/BcrA/BcrD ATPase family protein [Microlunatus speluncae]
MTELPLRAGYVIAVDAGGTHTRVRCHGSDGSLLAAATGRGGSPNHNDDAADNVADTVARALAQGDLDPADAIGFAAGLAGIGRTGSNQGGWTSAWAEEHFALPSLRCPRRFVNDAVVAHRGALLGEPGVMVVAGTGSMILAITADGREIESGQFQHYAGGARHLVFDLMHQILIGTTSTADAPLVAQVLEHWGVDDLTGLRRVILELAEVDHNDVKRRYGALAPLVTAAADTSPLADQAIRGLTDKTAHGVLLLAALVGTEPVPVAVTGALASDPAFADRLGVSLCVPGSVHSELVPPALDAVGGAALLAYEAAGLTLALDPPTITRLTQTPPTRH